MRMTRPDDSENSFDPVNKSTTIEVRRKSMDQLFQSFKYASMFPWKVPSTQFIASIVSHEDNRHNTVIIVPPPVKPSPHPELPLPPGGTSSPKPLPESLLPSGHMLLSASLVHSSAHTYSNVNSTLIANKTLGTEYGGEHTLRPSTSLPRTQGKVLLAMVE